MKIREFQFGTIEMVQIYITKKEKKDEKYKEIDFVKRQICSV